jgi:hypothetical protein
LLKQPISLKDFEELPFVRSLFFRYGSVSLLSHAAGKETSIVTRISRCKVYVLAFMKGSVLLKQCAGPYFLLFGVVSSVASYKYFPLSPGSNHVSVSDSASPKDIPINYNKNILIAISIKQVAAINFIIVTAHRIRRTSVGKDLDSF